MLTLADIQAAAGRIQGRVLRTPAVSSDAVNRATGAHVTLKLENLQTIGSFKERGAANKLALLTAAERDAGVLAVSAGNHAQAVARQSHLLGIAATIVMPRGTPATKITRTKSWGATVVLHGETLAEAFAHGNALAAEQGLTVIHPFDDPAVMAGQGTLALELLEDAPDLDMLVIPVGGGGMIAGCAVAAIGMRPDIEVIGVEVAAYAALAQTLKGRPVRTGGPTLAEGLAVDHIGAHPLAAIRPNVSDVLVVQERMVEEAICLLAEGAKLVAEGAGAAGVAALLGHPHRFAGKRVGIPICGGNIDARILTNVLLRGLVRDERLLRLTLDIPDKPGMLANIARHIAEQNGNVIEVIHQRPFAAPSVKSAVLEVTIETHDRAHADAIIAALAAEYAVRRSGDELLEGR